MRGAREVKEKEMPCFSWISYIGKELQDLEFGLASPMTLSVPISIFCTRLYSAYRKLIKIIKYFIYQVVAIYLNGQCPSTCRGAESSVIPKKVLHILHGSYLLLPLLAGWPNEFCAVHCW